MSRTVPFLEEHIANASLLGFLDNVARFNLAASSDLAAVIDRIFVEELGTKAVPSVANAASFSYWVKRCLPSSQFFCSDVCVAVVKIARRDALFVPSTWFLPRLRWCPLCSAQELHRFIHQHRAALVCHVHGLPLGLHCDSCGASSSYRTRRRGSIFNCAQCGGRLGERVQANDHSCRADRLSSWREELRSLREVQQLDVAGLPEPQCMAGSARPSSLPQDVRTLFVRQQSFDNAVASDLFRSLMRHFRLAPTPSMDLSYEEDLGPMLLELEALAMMADHRCLIRACGDVSASHCPCAVGYELWLTRSGLTARRDCSTVSESNSDYAASHLGFCLSLSMFAHAQVAQADVQSYIGEILDFHYPVGINPSGPPWRRGQGTGPTRIFDHRFQWFAVRCTMSAVRSESSDTPLVAPRPDGTFSPLKALQANGVKN